eukprot:TRINITY_DN1273_c0_g1_i1.p1 TRINITY_DN1273_c0_g1~~TRINITY_DN1273_c0_g1_i1.p1  ORF type:complete len:417 (+),score=144.33 TRINITY_DN1273_c0_g1_i1:47-1297(+)
MFRSTSSVSVGQTAIPSSTRAFSTKTSGKTFLVAGKRTPFGKFGEGLKDVTPVDLTVSCSKALLEETKISPKKIGHSILGNVIPSTTDTLYASRHVALKLGAPVETPCYNLNRLCGSGIQAIIDASNMIKRGETGLVLASGVENMSMTPHLLYSRWGTRFGSPQTADLLMDSLSDKYAGCSMAITAENLAQDFSVSRADCDQYSLKSHEKATKATKEGLLQGEISKYTLKKGEISVDEHIRQVVNIGDMNKLKATFKENGTVTPGTASGIVDGAAAVLIASEEFCNAEGVTPIAEIIDYSIVGVDPTRMGIGPSPAIKQLLQKTNMSLKDIDLIEINEAFAAQTLACAKDLGIDQAKLNIWGGAIAIGHPLGASGIRITNTLARQLSHTNGRFGIASACIGGGQGIAILIKNVKAK